MCLACGSIWKLLPMYLSHTMTKSLSKATLKSRIYFGLELEYTVFCGREVMVAGHGPVGHIAPGQEAGRMDYDPSLPSVFSLCVHPRTPVSKTGFSRCTGKNLSFYYLADVTECVKFVIHP